MIPEWECNHTNKVCGYKDSESEDRVIDPEDMPELTRLWGRWHSCEDCDYRWGAKSEYGKANPCSLCNNKIEKRVMTALTEGPEAAGYDGYVTKDSGVREEYGSGMVRDTQTGKPRFDLMLPRGVPYEAQFLTRVAALLARGAEKYEDRNWEKAQGEEELERFKSSADRHLMQWMCDESDEDHAAAVVFNLLAYETIKWKIQTGNSSPESS
jgi:hypothetical protein